VRRGFDFMAIAIVVIVLIVILIGVDVYLVADKVPGNTWSEMLRSAATHTTFVPWTLAVLAGRWFHPVDSMETLGGQSAGVAVLMVTSYVVVVAGDILRKRWKPVPGWIIVLIGVPTGVFFCPITFV
jgi:hypothetical protein